MKSFRAVVAVALAATLSVTSLQAQEGPPAAPALPDSVRSMVQEFEGLRQTIGEVQDSALQANPELVEARQAVQAFVQRKMLEANPGLEGDMERLGTLQQEAMQARAAQDTTRLQEIVREGSRIQQQVEAAQAATLETEAVQTRIQAFESRMVEAMVAIDPGVAEELERMEALAARLQAYQQGG